jgi:hypothetical protein
MSQGSTVCDQRLIGVFPVSDNPGIWSDQEVWSVQSVHPAHPPRLSMAAVLYQREQGVSTWMRLSGDRCDALIPAINRKAAREV